MSSSIPGPGAGVPPQPPASRAPPNRTRVLACVLCQQRKVKCDRKFPCANCMKQHAQCIPGTQVRRRRRFPEKDLLNRLRKYEDLLRQNNIKFDPLHKDPNAVEKGSDAHGDSDVSDDEESRVTSPSSSLKPENVFDTKSIWIAICQENQAAGAETPSADSLEHTVKEALALEQHANADNFLFGSPQGSVDISTLHPEPVDIFRLWQIYLDNINPLLKVTHTPTMQGRIIEAVGNIHNINPTLEALMFGIYCMSILSLSDEQCQEMFGSAKSDLRTKYQFGCQQSLMNASFLHAGDRESLTALYFYLLTLPFDMHPRSVSAMFGIGIRIAKNMNLHKENPPRCTVFEAEMRRRLWWSMSVDDARRCEMADNQDTCLSPAWDLKRPSNISDSELRPEMKELPTKVSKITDAIFVVLRSELADFIRNKTSFLDFSNPSLIPLTRDLPDGGSFLSLQNRIENEYIQYCDPENPVHLMAIWTFRGNIFKYRMVEYYSKVTRSGLAPTDEQLDEAMLLAIGMIEADEKLVASPLTKGFLWFLRMQFPFPAYMQIIYDLRRRPLSPNATRAWTAMSNLYEARMKLLSSKFGPVLRVFGKFIQISWAAREAVSDPQFPLPPLPRIVQRAKEMETMYNTDPSDNNPAPPGAGQFAGMDLDDVLNSMPSGSEMFDMYEQNGGGLSGMGLNAFNLTADQFNWPS